MSEGENVTVGWREWVSMPVLGLPAIKAKIDTGARTSALHAFDIERDSTNDRVSFNVNPLQRNDDLVIRCEAPLVDVRRVTDSGGHSEERLFVRAEITVGPLTREIEVTLTERRDMLFRMLLGRTALVPGFLVDPAQSFLHGRRSARKLYPPSEAGVER